MEDSEWLIIKKDTLYYSARQAGTKWEIVRHNTKKIKDESKKISAAWITITHLKVYAVSSILDRLINTNNYTRN